MADRFFGDPGFSSDKPSFPELPWMHPDALEAARNAFLAEREKQSRTSYERYLSELEDLREFGQDLMGKPSLDDEAAAAEKVRARTEKLAGETFPDPELPVGKNPTFFTPYPGGGRVSGGGGIFQILASNFNPTFGFLGGSVSGYCPGGHAWLNTDVTVSDFSFSTRNLTVSANLMMQGRCTVVSAIGWGQAHLASRLSVMTFNIFTGVTRVFTALDTIYSVSAPVVVSNFSMFNQFRPIILRNIPVSPMDFITSTVTIEQSAGAGGIVAGGVSNWLVGVASITCA